MTDLSPAAQAVLDAAFPAYDDMQSNVVTGEQHAGLIAAAAIRAAANQVVPEHYSCCTGRGEFDFGMDARNEAIREAILAIADELEGL